MEKLSTRAGYGKALVELAEKYNVEIERGKEKYKGIFPAFYACYDDEGNVSAERQPANQIAGGPL